MYKLLSSTVPEVLDLPTVKNHLRVDVADDDALIGLFITAVRQHAEQITGLALTTRQTKYVFDSFPGAQLASMGAPWGCEYSTADNVLILERGPHQSIDSVQYLDMSGTLQAMPATDYAADLSGLFARLTPAFGKIWPISLPQIGACSVTFTSGYGPDGTNVPGPIKQWMLLRLGALYENREEVIVGRSVTVAPLPFVDMLLEPYSIVLP